jgi:hypothetical protein
MLEQASEFGGDGGHVALMDTIEGGPGVAADAGASRQRYANS